MDDIEREATRDDSWQPDDPAVVAAIDLVRWELSLLAEDIGTTDQHNQAPDRLRLQ